MVKELISAKKSTPLRKNGSQVLNITLNHPLSRKLFIINGPNFIIEHINPSHLIIKPLTYYMIINNNSEDLELTYNLDASKHEVIYDPYKYEHFQKEDIRLEQIVDKYKVPIGYNDTLAKWYSFKFTYPDFNLIFVKPEMGLSIQIHAQRSEKWEILAGTPIILSNNKVYYYVKDGSIFSNQKNSYHTIINPNKDKEKYVIVKEYWEGTFDEQDIVRAFNPNNYP